MFKPGSILHLVWGNLWSQRFSTSLTIMLTAVALALSFSTLSLRDQAKNAFLNGSGGYDAVLGSRGSALQLVLNSLFHLETSPGNIPWSLYESVKAEPGVRKAYPIAVGDSFRGFRVVGTVAELLTDPPAKAVVPEFASGRVFDPSRREAAIGSEVARSAGLTVGSQFEPTHGLGEDGHSHSEQYVVVGVLKPTNTPMDRVLWIPLEGILRMEGHVLRHEHEEYQAQPGQAIPEEFQEVSAVLVEFSSPQVGMGLSQRINRQGKEATMAFPVAREVGEIFQRLGWAHRLLSLFAFAILLVASGAILASLTVSSEMRRRDYALLRTLGMTRLRLSLLLVVEGGLTTLLGLVASLPLSLFFSYLAADWVRAATGVTLKITQVAPETFGLAILSLSLGCGAGIVPAWRVYHQELSSQLDPESV